MPLGSWQPYKLWRAGRCVAPSLTRCSTTPESREWTCSESCATTPPDTPHPAYLPPCLIFVEWFITLTSEELCSSTRPRWSHPYRGLLKWSAMWSDCLREIPPSPPLCSLGPCRDVTVLVVVLHKAEAVTDTRTLPPTTLSKTLPSLGISSNQLEHCLSRRGGQWVCGTAGFGGDA